MSAINWIKCSERLPDNGRYVLIFDGRICTGYFDIDDGWLEADDETKCDPTHWAELPEPPSE